MSGSSRLTLFSAAATLLMAGSALAQAGPAAGAASAPPAPADETKVEPRQPNVPQDRIRPPGCPYRDGKLELIV